MTYKQITDTLSEKGISVEGFCERLFKSYYGDEKPVEWLNSEIRVPWLGKVDMVLNNIEEYAATEDCDYFAMLNRVYYLPEHDVYLQVTASSVEAPEWQLEDGSDNPEREEWELKYPGKYSRWDYSNRFSPVRPVTKTIVEYQYAPELREADVN